MMWTLGYVAIGIIVAIVADLAFDERDIPLAIVAFWPVFAFVCVILAIHKSIWLICEYLRGESPKQPPVDNDGFVM